MSNANTPISTLIPTRLLDPLERKAVPPVKPHSKRFRFLVVSFKLLGLYLGDLWLRLGGEKNSALREKRTIECLQGLGTIWIRIFQTLAMRSAMLSSASGLRLMDLREIGSFIQFEQVRQIVENELGRTMETVFDEFEGTPFFATTVSQLHRARLAREQEWTAVKVQQPLAEEIFELDLKLFQFFIWLSRMFSIKDGVHWEELLHELKEIKTRELNYYYEATALETLNKNLKGQPVHVPKIYRQYCSKRVLVMEFIQGALLSDIISMKRENPERCDAWLKKNNIDLVKVGRRLFRSTFRQVFEDNFFHGDMNTHTIILLQNSHIAMIECRSAGSLEIESLKKQKLLLRSLTEKEYVIAAEIYFLLASRLPRIDLNTVKEQLVRVWRIWETRTHIKTLPYNQKSHAYMTGQVNQVVYDSEFSPLWSFAKLTIAWVHLDIAMDGLVPELNYLEELKSYFHQAEIRGNLTKLVHLPSRIASTMSSLHQVPKRNDEYQLFRETLLRRQAQVVQGSASKLDAVIASAFGMVSFSVFLVTLFFILVFCQRYLNLGVEFIMGEQISGLAAIVPNMNMAGWLLLFGILGFLYRFFNNQKKQFKSYEFGGNDRPASFET